LCKITGWYFREPERSDGTVIWLHGFGGSCVGNDLPKTLYDIRKEFKVCTVAFDFRCHGCSDDRIPSLGLAESWDTMAVLSYLEENHFPRPFVLVGESMGGMIAGHVARCDSRVEAAICLMPPSCPLYAMLGLPKILQRLLRRAVKRSYQADLLLDSDLTFHNCNPEHKPLLFYIMGENDPYDWRKTKIIWDHWYKETPSQFDVGPEKAPNQRKWFQVIPDKGHDLSKILFPYLVDYFTHAGLSADPMETRHSEYPLLPRMM